ncbi:MAG: type II toxin-antitoxin system RelE/ParE family toxin [Saprospiraceae bacterium]|nr:type II toxin-antitoxin system RelE/ParE family toxin [Saprospiraceae bacterium]
MSASKKFRRVFRYKDYFDRFFNKQRTKVKEKIIWTLELIEDIEHVPEKYFKHLSDTDGLYEIRVKHGSDIYRIFCFFDYDKLVILMNGFQKKTQKTPKRLIEQAKLMKKQYEKEKSK